MQSGDDVRTSLWVGPGPACDRVPRIPGSKSLTNRALLLAALARGRSSISGWLDADDTRLMVAALRALDVSITGGDDPGQPLQIDGRGGPLRCDHAPTLQVGTAGTVARFLLAAVAASPGVFVLDGSARMRERPMGGLVAALRDRGAVLTALERADALPLRSGPHPAALRGGTIVLERPASSQFVSALAFAGLLADAPLEIVLREGTPARPYVDMTLAVIRSFGGEARWSAADRILVTPTVLTAMPYRVEPDASAATYFLAQAAIYGGSCRIDALGHDSLQGDAAFVHVLGRMGAQVEQRGDVTVLHGGAALQGGTFALDDMPDTALTLAVVALFARGPTHITGVGVLRHHESDRLAAAACELRKLGAAVEVFDDGLRITPPSARPEQPVAIDTYDDHRMAMAFSLAGAVEIRDPACVAKTFPGYFDELARLGVPVQRTPG
ncbi:MAG: 3-phosphoshikimate 1-carboxyvinyltransferase [Nannocystaceae bacterium]|nr:3-phosphoshikimate 1-carboxyvinyltransferase [Deltaproteobacteria bacterium]MBP7290201.1 3-phosphoshikimate 1-carboxyvinyltransferase [Nannocystaceae bacterium]